MEKTTFATSSAVWPLTEQYRHTSRSHFEEISRFLAESNDPDDHKQVTTGDNSPSSAREQLSRVTSQQLHQLSSALWNELVRRRGETPLANESPDTSVPSPVEEKHKLDLSYLPAHRLAVFSSDLRHELCRRYPELSTETANVPLSLGYVWNIRATAYDTASLLTYQSSESRTTDSNDTISSSLQSFHGTGTLAAAGLEAVGKIMLRGLDFLAMTRKLSAAKSIIPHRDSEDITPGSSSKLDGMYEDLFDMVFRHRQYPKRFGAGSNELLLRQMRYRDFKYSARLLMHLSKWPTRDIIVFIRKWPEDCRSAVQFDELGGVVTLRESLGLLTVANLTRLGEIDRRALQEQEKTDETYMRSLQSVIANLDDVLEPNISQQPIRDSVNMYDIDSEDVDEEAIEYASLHEEMASLRSVSPIRDREDMKHASLHDEMAGLRSSSSFSDTGGSSYIYEDYPEAEYGTTEEEEEAIQAWLSASPDDIYNPGYSRGIINAWRSMLADPDAV